MLYTYKMQTICSILHGFVVVLKKSFADVLVLWWKRVQPKRPLQQYQLIAQRKYKE